MFDIASHTCQLQGVAYSQKGGRAENQDNIYFLETPLGFLVMVCDGMGGGPSGGMASELAIKTFVQSLSTLTPMDDAVVALRQATTAAHSAIARLIDDNPELKGMGSTLVALLITSHSALVVHLGDSRCYKLRGRGVAFRTADHSLVGELVRNGTLTEEQARTSPQSNIISRALGATNCHEPDITRLAYRKGDRFLLCTDGVWGMMPEKRLVWQLTARGNLASVAADLSTLIEQKGYANGNPYDNHTLALIEMNTDSILKDPMTKKQKIVFLILALLLMASVVLNLTTCSNTLASSDNNNTLTATADSTKLDNTDSISSQDSYDKYYKAYREAYTEMYDQINAERAMMQHIIDSLNRRITSMENSFAQKTGTAGSRRPPTVSIGKLATLFINECQQMITVKDKNQRKAVNIKVAHRDKMNNYLLQMEDKLAEEAHKNMVRQLKEELLSDTIIYVNPPDENGWYRSTHVAIIKLKGIKQKMEQLKQELEQATDRTD